MSSDVAPERPTQPDSSRGGPPWRDGPPWRGGSRRRGGSRPGGGPPWRDAQAWREGRSWEPSTGRRRRHGSIVGAILLGVFELVGAHVASHHQPHATPLDHLGYTLLILGVLALPFRLRWRVPALAVTLAATIVYIMLGYPTGPTFLAALVSVFGAVRAGKRRAVWIGLGVGYAAYFLAGWLSPTIGRYALRQPSLVGSIQAAVWLVLVIAIAEATRVRTAHFVEVRRTMAEQARAKTEQERRQATEERLRIAQELHDVLGHHLSLINVQAGVGLHLMDDDPEQARVALEAIKQASTEALGEVRGVLAAMRPKDEKAPRTPAPSPANLDALIDPVNTAIIGTPIPLPPEVDRAAYRIVQESLTNVRRHAVSTAGGSVAALVTITYAPERLTIRVIDDGTGAAVVGEASGTGTGIAGMRTRAEALGGTFTAGPEAGGFAVVAALPVPASANSGSVLANGGSAPVDAGSLPANGACAADGDANGEEEVD